MMKNRRWHSLCFLKFRNDFHWLILDWKVMSEPEFNLSEQIERTIFRLRGHRVMLDEHLANLYEVKVRLLNQAVKRNSERFPDDFMFQLSTNEVKNLRSQIVISSLNNDSKKLPVKKNDFGYGGRRYRPYAFTEQGVAMLSSVLSSARAVKVNIEIMRAFVRLRQMLSSNAELASKLAGIEKKYDAQFKVVFDAIRELMSPSTTSLIPKSSPSTPEITPTPVPRRIGFDSGSDD